MIVTEGGVTDPALRLVTRYQYDKNNRLEYEIKTTSGKSEENFYSYDRNGNQIFKKQVVIERGVTDEASFTGFIAGKEEDTGGVYFYEYDGFNRLIGFTGDGMTISYTYNGSGLRTGKTVNGVRTTYVWDGQNIVLEIDGANNVKSKYIRGVNLISRYDSESNLMFYLYNGHGDVTHLVPIHGDVINYDYDSFGNEKDPTEGDTNPFRYAGEYWDEETGTYYLRARYYDPGIGRFICEDSFWGFDNDPLSLNLYTYCANNPVLFIDPDGEFWQVAAGALIGATAGAVISYGTQVAANISQNGFSADAFTDVNWKAVGASAVGGAVTGALLTVPGAQGVALGMAKTMAWSGASVATGNAVNQVITKGEINYVEYISSGLTGAAFGGFSHHFANTNTIIIKDTSSNVTITHRGTNESIALKVEQGVLKANYPRPNNVITRQLEHSKPVVWVSQGKPTFWNRMWSGMAGKRGEASVTFKVNKSVIKKPDGWFKRWFGNPQRVIEQDVNIPKDAIVRYKE
ncbi:UNVERIFIED_CONTAM: RHS repeat-associated protein [Acetivibrio alkalicellulosi]